MYQKGVFNPHKRVTDLRLLGLSAAPVRDASKRFLTSLKASNAYSQRYLESLEFSLALLSKYAEWEEWPGVAQPTASHLEDYLAYLQTRPRWFGERGDGKPPSQSHIETQYRRIKTCFNWLVQRGHVERNPMDLIPHPHVDERTIETVAERQMLTLLELVNPQRARTSGEHFRLTRNRAALYVLWDTPSRRDEIANLTLEEVDWDQAGLHVLGKGRKERWMAVDFLVLEALWEYRDLRDDIALDTNSLWVSDGGLPMQPSWIYQMLKRLGNQAGVPNLHTHRFRHTYAMNMLRSGMQERYLAFEGGWSKIPATYFRTLGPEQVAERHRELSPVAQLQQSSKVRQRKPGSTARRRL